MYRLSGTVGDKIRLAQRTNAPTISILFEDGTIILNKEPTKQLGSLTVRFYDFTPLTQGTYFIRWNGAQPDQEFEIMDVKPNSLRWLVNRIKDKTDRLPTAMSG